jgi:DNA-binding NarL/FixJ family response regulator
MFLHGRAPMDRQTAVDEDLWLAPDEVPLAAALGTALTVRGWRKVRLLSEPALKGPARDAGPAARLVLVADAAGRFPDPGSALAGAYSPFVVVVGTGRAFSLLADAVDQRVAAVLDGDQPFEVLAAALDQLLRLGQPCRDSARLAAELRQREDEARRFARLTDRERDVLAGMLAGLAATKIAEAQQVSLATVRSHIRAVLTKLGVSSQLAAVALAHRSCRDPSLAEQIRKLHQF